MDLIKAKGGKVTREPGPVKGGNTVIAFVEDPDGYKFELLERGPTPEPFCQVMLRVGDLDRSINFYEKVRTFLPDFPFFIIKRVLNVNFRHLAWSYFERETTRSIK